jgi:hypothetical protein
MANTVAADVTAFLKKNSPKAYCRLHRRRRQGEAPAAGDGSARSRWAHANDPALRRMRIDHEKGDQHVTRACMRTR